MHSEERDDTASNHGSPTGEQPSRPHGDPLCDPIGTVRVHPADDSEDPRSRRLIKTSTGTWQNLSECAVPRPDDRQWEQLRTWPHQRLDELARVFGHIEAPCRSTVSERSSPHERTAPSFWEAAKIYCRARNTASERSFHWYRCYCATTRKPDPDP